LDLVQWATEKWSKVPITIARKHLINDLPVLKYLLTKDFEIMFLNGKTVVENVSNCLNITLKETSTIFKNTNNIDMRLIIYQGEYKKIKVVGWNIYLQSPAAGGYENKNILCDIIKKNT
jgi:hypothetical protein